MTRRDIAILVIVLVFLVIVMFFVGLTQAPAKPQGTSAERVVDPSQQGLVPT